LPRSAAAAHVGDALVTAEADKAEDPLGEGGVGAGIHAVHHEPVEKALGLCGVVEEFFDKVYFISSQKAGSSPKETGSEPPFST